MKIKLTECARPECEQMIPEHPPGTPGRRREFCSNSCRTVTWNRAHRKQRRAQKLERDRLWREALAGISP
jgi:hypothetical protein